MERVPLETCLVALSAGGSTASCVHADDALAWARRHDAAPCLTLLNAFVAVQLSLVDAGAHSGMALTLTVVHVLVGALAFVALAEASAAASQLMGVPALALRTQWGDSEPLLMAPALVLAGALLGAAHAWATRAPPLFELHASSARPYSWWRNAKHALQAVIVAATSFYVAQEPAGYEATTPQRWARPEWCAYTVARTLALLIVYVWNRTDSKNRVLVYGPLVRDYDAVWVRLALVYGIMLASCAFMWAQAWRVAVAQWVAGAVAVAVCVWQVRGATPRSAWGRLEPL